MNMLNPAHSGEILKDLVIDALELTITDVAQHLDVSLQRPIGFVYQTLLTCGKQGNIKALYMPHRIIWLRYKTRLAKKLSTLT